MNKTIFYFLIAFGLINQQKGFAQNHFPISGNVGIGTDSPENNLDIVGTGEVRINIKSANSNSVLRFRENSTARDAAIIYHQDGRMTFNLDNTSAQNWTTNEYLTILPTGKIGIGTTDPTTDLELLGSSTAEMLISSQGHDAILHLRESSSARDGAIVLHKDGRLGLHLDNSTAQNWTTNEYLTVRPNGNIGIGTTSTGSHKLAVEGSVGAREIKVEASGWSDFVFKNDYELRTLEEVEQHISEKGHLPEIPNEAEVIENGINLGEMDSKLLQKIEELTLYLIEQNKQNLEQQKLIEQLQNEVLALKNK